MAATPVTPEDHHTVSEAMTKRIERIWPVMARVRNEAFELAVLALVHYVVAEIPDADFVSLVVTDQGGDTMTFGNIGVRRDKYDAWTDDRSYEAVAHPRKPGVVTADLVTIARDGQEHEYVLIDTTYDVFNMNDGGLGEDEIYDHCMNLEDDQLAEWGRFFERTNGRRSGMGRLWIADAVEALERTFEGFIGETLDPMPDPADTIAVARWVTRSTAQED